MPTSPRSGSEHPESALFEAAREVQSRAHVPYSHFPVGAALRTASGRVHVGCNVENAAYPQGWCAEASAIAAMVSAPFEQPGDRRIEALVTVCEGVQLSTCCGGCRQKIREFAGPTTLVYAAGPEGIRKRYSMDELLPDSFGPEHLDR